ncbi:MAG: dockerin type I repeat-containing protein [Oscillospiraceae bacterium]|jgi:predicted DNA binding protein|nr:dockerin type I repeat-containing protein [Oscillospiraceae bacterium]
MINKARFMPILGMVLAGFLFAPSVTAFAAEAPLNGFTVSYEQNGKDVFVCFDYGDEVVKRLLGDIDNDGKVTAADARTALRSSAKLEALIADDRVVADMDRDSKMTAADARTILRVSAKLQNFDPVVLLVADGQVDIDAVIKIVTESVKGFDVSEYSVKVNQHHITIYSVHFTKMISGYKANSSVTVYIKDGVLDKIYDNTKTTSVTSLTKPSVEFEESVMKEAAEILRGWDLEIISQEVDYFYDITKNEKKITVFSLCSYDGGITVGSYAYQVVID